VRIRLDQAESSLATLTQSHQNVKHQLSKHEKKYTQNHDQLTQKVQEHQSIQDLDFAEIRRRFEETCQKMGK
jgi:multidrug resistance efflux pump